MQQKRTAGTAGFALRRKPMQCESTSTETELRSVSDMHWHVVDRKPPLQARRAKWG